MYTFFNKKIIQDTENKKCILLSKIIQFFQCYCKYDNKKHNQYIKQSEKY